MIKRLTALLLALLLTHAGAALATEGAYLSGESLQALEPAFEAFLNALADELTAQGLLPAEERDAWLLYQLGDFLQNGGYGSIAVLYTPGLLAVADASVAARRMTAHTRAGEVRLETLNRYSPDHSPLPGLPLYVEVFDEGGAAVPCRFRWVVPEGQLLVWEGQTESVVHVGATYINDGKPLYWLAQPAEGTKVTLALELLSLTADETLARIELTVKAGYDFWEPEVLQ